MVIEMDRPQSAPKHQQSDASTVLLSDVYDYKRVSQSSEAKVDAAGESTVEAPAAKTNTPFAEE